VTQVASVSREQNDGISQINTAVSQMDKVTQSNAATAEESSAAAEELNAQAATMKQSVAELLQLVGGAATKSEPAVTQPKEFRPVRSAARVSTLSAHNGSNGHTKAAATLAAHKVRRNEIPMAGDFKDF